MARMQVGARRLDVRTAPERLPPTTARQLRNVTLRRRRVALTPGVVRGAEALSGASGVTSLAVSSSRWVAPDGAQVCVSAFASGLVRSYLELEPEYLEADF